MKSLSTLLTRQCTCTHPPSFPRIPLLSVCRYHSSVEGTINPKQQYTTRLPAHLASFEAEYLNRCVRDGQL